MSSLNSGPKWWQLYLSLPLLITLFAFETRLKISQRGHQTVQIGIVLLVYSLIHFWLKSNARAFSQLDRKQYDSAIRIVRVSIPELSDSRTEKRSILQLSEDEIQELLSEAMDMSYIAAESSMLDKTRRN